MKLALSCLLVLAVASPSAAVTPVAKVVTLLESMLAKGKAEKHDEEVQFAAYKTFCDDFVKEKAYAISQAEETITVLKASIQKYTADSDRLTKEIAAHETDIAAWSASADSATKEREKERATYVATHKDYSESIDALQRAITVLKKQAYDRKQKESLTQVSALRKLNLIPAKAKKAIDLFFAQGTEDLDISAAAPEANAYEFQSSGIVDMLEKLLEKFMDERDTKMKEEMNTKHAYELLMQDLKAQIAQATKSKGEKASIKASNLQAKADAEGDLTDTTTTMQEDKKAKADTTATCKTKASDFESRQQLRADELVAIDKAIEIIKSSAVSGAAKKYLPTLVQKKPALAQLRASSPQDDQIYVAHYLRDQAKRLNSRVLSAIAVRAAEDPFKKVKKLIKDLIVRLMEEANEEAEHKGWCDTELTTNEQTRTEKTQTVDTLTADIDELTSSIAQLSEDITELAKAIADLDAAMATATKLRLEEKTSNAETIKDAQDAQTAVSQAISILKEFYEKAGEATAFVQQAPAIFDSPYQGMSAENGGVVGMLEVIESDFARLESDTKSDEVGAQKSYDEFMTDSKVDKAAKTTDSEHKTRKKQDESQALTQKSMDLEGTQKELSAALEYYEKLKPSCIDAGVSYDDRTSRRKEEIQSLQEALRILNGEDIA